MPIEPTIGFNGDTSAGWKALAFPWNEGFLLQDYAMFGACFRLTRWALTGKWFLSTRLTEFLTTLARAAFLLSHSHVLRLDVVPSVHSSLS